MRKMRTGNFTEVLPESPRTEKERVHTTNLNGSYSGNISRKSAFASNNSAYLDLVAALDSAFWNSNSSSKQQDTTVEKNTYKLTESETIYNTNTPGLTYEILDGGILKIVGSYDGDIILRGGELKILGNFRGTLEMYGGKLKIMGSASGNLKYQSGSIKALGINNLRRI